MFTTRQCRNVGLLLSLSFLVTLAACNRKIGIDQSEQRPRVNLQEGDYLSTAYIDQLKKTRSPLAAGSQHGVHQFMVRKTGSVVQLEPIFNFHEGGEIFALRPDGSLARPDSRYVSNLTVSVLDGNSFRIGFDSAGESFKPADYVFVRDAAAYVARIILTGRYKDRHGLNYEFREDGYAVLPDCQFRFEIGMDHVLTPFDYVMEMGPKGIASSVTAFKWQGRNLQLFRTKEDENGFDQIVGRSPYLSLKPEP